MDIGREYLSEGEVAQLTGRALSSLRNDRSRRRGIPFIRWGRRFIRYKKADVLIFMDSRRVETDDTTRGEDR
jgi:hypothetical protein